jgi:predicted GNAT family N-acyltransferase
MSRALAIRLRVFVEEQGVPPDEEIDAHDRDDPIAVHALARDASGAPIGAGRYYVAEPGVVQIGRMAVLAETRGTGAGAGYLRAHLHAQVNAREFYLKSGFSDDGETLWDAGILHQPMSLELVSHPGL